MNSHERWPLATLQMYTVCLRLVDAGAFNEVEVHQLRERGCALGLGEECTTLRGAAAQHGDAPRVAWALTRESLLYQTMCSGGDTGACSALEQLPNGDAARAEAIAAGRELAECNRAISVARAEADALHPDRDLDDYIRSQGALRDRLGMDVGPSEAAANAAAAAGGAGSSDVSATPSVSVSVSSGSASTGNTPSAAVGTPGAAAGTGEREAREQAARECAEADRQSYACVGACENSARQCKTTRDTQLTACHADCNRRRDALLATPGAYPACMEACGPPRDACRVGCASQRSACGSGCPRACSPALG